jgi:hypothetical protein
VFTKVSKEDLITRMKTVLLRPLIYQLCQKFVDETNIPIYIRLAPELTFLRVDCELFNAILSEVIRFALKRIDLDITKQLRHRHTNDNHPSHSSHHRKYTQQHQNTSAQSEANYSFESADIDNIVDEGGGKEHKEEYPNNRLFQIVKDMFMDFVDFLFENHRNDQDESENKIDREPIQQANDEDVETVVKSSYNDLIDDSFQNDSSIPKLEKQKSWQIKHQILIWLTSAEPSEGKEYAFKDVRGMQIQVLDTSRYPDSFNNSHGQQYFHFYESTTTNLFQQDSHIPAKTTEQQRQQQETTIPVGSTIAGTDNHIESIEENIGVRGENRIEDGEPLSDRFVDLFQITSRTSCTYQYGPLLHAQYKSFQRITLPFKLSVDSNRWQNMFPNDINRLCKIQTTSKSYYPTYVSYVVNDLPDHLKEQFFLWISFNLSNH